MNSLIRHSHRRARAHAKWLHTHEPFPQSTHSITFLKDSDSLEMDNDDLHVVFLEGASCTAKSTILQKLDKMGYAVQLENFVEMCEEWPQYSPTGTIMTLKWSSRLLAGLEALIQQETRPKANVAFFDRSFISPAIYSGEQPESHYLFKVMNEIRKLPNVNISMVLCTSDEYAVQLRLAHRFQQSATDTQGVRESLGETNNSFQEETTKRYESLQKTGYFDAVLDTSVPKIAVATLLNALGITFMDSIRPPTVK